jgi:hypothetical protein
MASLFSSSEYIDIVVYGEASGVLLESREFPCHLVYSIPIEVLRKRVENAVTAICNNRRMLVHVEESFRRRLHYCIDNNGGQFEHFLQWLVITGYSNYFMRIFTD